LLTDVVAAALGVRDESPRPLVEVLVEHLSSRKLLLVLDNCEQVVDESAKLAETLLRACPELRILATSREPLGIGGETVHPLAPLAIPDPDREPTLRGLPGCDAVALFAERAAAAVPGYRITDENKAVVAWRRCGPTADARSRPATNTGSCKRATKSGTGEWWTKPNPDGSARDRCTGSNALTGSCRICVRRWSSASRHRGPPDLTDRSAAPVLDRPRADQRGTTLA
jgi:hypothetical protein